MDSEKKNAVASTHKVTRRVTRAKTALRKQSNRKRVGRDANSARPLPESEAGSPPPTSKAQTLADRVEYAIYDAHPLDFGESLNIRLIEVLSNKSSIPSTTISCKLHVISLEEAPKFTALSYVWGPPEVTRIIQVDGVPFTIRENLWKFLAQYCSRGVTEYLWIDALCIDQDRLQERNHQVTMMGQIYRSANSVIAWLGDELEGDLITSASGLEQFRSSGSLSDEVLGNIKEALNKISRCEYWERLWVVQEFTLAQTVALWSGSGTLSVDTLIDLADFQGQYCDVRETLFIGNFQNPAKAILIGRKRSPKDEWFYLHKLVARFKSSKCTDLRDRVYGLLGLVHPQELQEYPIEADYSLPLPKLFLLVCRRLHARESLFDGILQSDMTEPLREALEIPQNYQLPNRWKHITPDTYTYDTPWT